MKYQDCFRYHKNLAKYFSSKSLVSYSNFSRGYNIRKIYEHPWQLFISNQWQELKNALVNPEYLIQLYANSHFDINRYWVQIESLTGCKAIDAYNGFLSNPSKDNLTIIRILVSILSELGYREKISETYEWILQESDAFDHMEMNLEKAVTKFNANDLEEASRLVNDVIYQSQKGQSIAQNIKSGQNENSLEVKDDVPRSDKMSDFLYNYYYKLLAPALRLRSAIFYDMSIYDLALLDINSSIDIYRKIGDKEGIQNCLGELSQIYISLGNFNESISCSKEKESICRLINNFVGIQNALGEQASAKERKGNYYEAELLYKEQEKICTEYGFRNELIPTQQRIVRSLLLQKKFDEALNVYTDIESTCIKMDYPELLEASFETLAMQLIKMQQVELFNEPMQRYISYLKTDIQKDRLIEFCSRQAEQQYEDGRYSESLMLLTSLNIIYKQTGMINELENCLANMIMLQIEKGDITEAISTIQEKESVSVALETQSEHFQFLDIVIKWVTDTNNDRYLHLFEDNKLRFQNQYIKMHT